VRTSPDALDWLGVLRRYLALSAILHFVWEIAQLPLYTIWRAGSRYEIAFAVVHCTAGDVIIAAIALVAALVVVGDRTWPSGGYRGVAVAAIVCGVFYTVYSEWVNVVVRKSWAYAPLMPLLPGFGTGLAPVLQWIAVPSIALWVSRRVA
jgi:hypothetical protein